MFELLVEDIKRKLKRAKEAKEEPRETVKNLLMMKFGDYAENYLEKIEDLDVDKLRKIV